jgi:hypothetical protein
MFRFLLFIVMWQSRDIFEDGSALSSNSPSHVLCVHRRLGTLVATHRIFSILSLISTCSIALYRMIHDIRPFVSYGAKIQRSKLEAGHVLLYRLNSLAPLTALDTSRPRPHKLPPTPHLARHAPLLVAQQPLPIHAHLPLQRLHPQRRTLGIVQQRQSEIHRVSTGNVVLVFPSLAASLSEVDHGLDLVLVKDLAETTLVCRGEEDAFAGDVGDGSQGSLDRGGGDVELETERVERFGDEGKLGRVRRATDEDAGTRAGRLEASRREK